MTHVQTKQPRVSSKVVKVPHKDTSTDQRSDRFNKFSHLKDDPDFRDFLNEVLDDRTKQKKSSEKRKKGNELELDSEFVKQNNNSRRLSNNL